MKGLSSIIANKDIQYNIDMKEGNEIVDLFKLTTPLYGTTTIEVESFIEQLQARLRQVKEDNNHFGYDIKRYVVTIDVEGQLWLSGEK